MCVCVRARAGALEVAISALNGAQFSARRDLHWGVAGARETRRRVLSRIRRRAEESSAALRSLIIDGPRTCAEN